MRIFENEKFLYQFVMYGRFSSNKTRVLYCFIRQIKNDKSACFLVRSRFSSSFVPNSKIHNSLLVYWILTNKVLLESLESLVSDNIYFEYLCLSDFISKIENTETGRFCFPDRQSQFVLIISFKP